MKYKCINTKVFFFFDELKKNWTPRPPPLPPELYHAKSSSRQCRNRVCVVQVPPPVCKAEPKALGLFVVCLLDCETEKIKIKNDENKKESETCINLTYMVSILAPSHNNTRELNPKIVVLPLTIV
jgi:hypothetical protein